MMVMVEAAAQQFGLWFMMTYSLIFAPPDRPEVHIGVIRAPNGYLDTMICVRSAAGWDVYDIVRDKRMKMGSIRQLGDTKGRYVVDFVNGEKEEIVFRQEDLQAIKPISKNPNQNLRVNGRFVNVHTSNKVVFVDFRGQGPPLQTDSVIAPQGQTTLRTAVTLVLH